MPKFDPYKPPLSVEESERLLTGARNRDATKARTAYDLALTGGILKVLLAVIAVGAAFWFLGEAIGGLAAVVLGVLFFYFRDRDDQ